MSITKIVGGCCNSLCSLAGQCQHYTGVVGGNCNCCNCHESLHRMIGFITPDQVYHACGSIPAPAVVAKPTAKVNASLPMLSNKDLTQAERVGIFNKTLSPIKAPTQPPKKRAIVASHKVNAKKSKVVYTPLENTESNRIIDREEALREAPEGIQQTDLDMLHRWRINGEWWIPPPEEKDEVDDLSRYCFACCKQHLRRDREVCSGYICKRWMFVDCGSHTHNEYDYDNEDSLEFKCCTCSDEHLAEKYETYFSSLPRRVHATGTASSSMGFTT